MPRSSAKIGSAGRRIGDPSTGQWIRRRTSAPEHQEGRPRPDPMHLEAGHIPPTTTTRAAQARLTIRPVPAPQRSRRSPRPRRPRALARRCSPAVAPPAVAPRASQQRHCQRAIALERRDVSSTRNTAAADVRDLLSFVRSWHGPRACRPSPDGRRRGPSGSIQPRLSSRCSDWYSAASSTPSTPSGRSRTQRDTAQPCSGSKNSAFSTSRSSVPLMRSSDSRAAVRFPLETVGQSRGRGGPSRNAPDAR